MLTVFFNFGFAALLLVPVTTQMLVPAATRMVAVEYPNLARGAKVQEIAAVSCTVATDGTVKSRSNPERQHTVHEALKNNLREWRFAVN
jgi:hypothetical protein